MGIGIDLYTYLQSDQYRISIFDFRVPVLRHFHAPREFLWQVSFIEMIEY